MQKRHFVEANQDCGYNDDSLFCVLFYLKKLNKLKEFIKYTI